MKRQLNLFGDPQEPAPRPAVTTTPDQFADLVEEAIEAREIQVWEIYDLRLLVREARKRGVVHRVDLTVLKLSGKKVVSPGLQK